MYKQIPKAPLLEINESGQVRRCQEQTPIFPDKIGNFTFPTEEGKRTLFNIVELVQELHDIKLETVPLSPVKTPVVSKFKTPPKATNDKKENVAPAKKGKVKPEKKAKENKERKSKKECRTLEQLPAKAKKVIADNEMSKSDKVRALVESGMSLYEIKKLTGIRRTLIRAALKKGKTDDKA